MAQKKEDLLQRPLYVFDLPEEILFTLTLKHGGERPAEPAPKQLSEKKPLEPTEASDGAPASATSCNLCGLKFPTLQDQRSHVRSDFHRYNLKQKIAGRSCVAEAEFEKLVGDLDESISGSDSSESESADEDGPKPTDTALSALLKRQAKVAHPEADEFSSTKRKRGSGNPPLLWFATSALPDNVSLGLYRAIFTGAEQEEPIQIVDTIRNKQLAPLPGPSSNLKDGGVPLQLPKQSPHYFLCMIGGGHFAAMVVSLAPKVGKKHTGSHERQAAVLAHKTFHRYTTRRKQGGSQAANDSAKGAAHSAGSSLRRYNEAALTNEVRELLIQWKSMIDTAELLFVRATGSTNRNTLFGPYQGHVLTQDDPRNRGFPFSTRRATQAELMRSFVELTRVKVSYVDEAALAAEAAAAAEKSEVSARSATPSKPSKPRNALSEEEELASLHTTQLTSLIRRSKAPAVLSYLSSNNLTSAFQFYPPSIQQHYHAPTPLHLAASVNSPAVVLGLLTKAGADPGFSNTEGKTAFEIAGDRPTRDAFRIARHELGESKWDWEHAKVPSALSRAEADKRTERERTEENAREAERRKIETERLRKESEQDESERREKRIGKGRVIAALEKSGADKREEEARGMTPEMRARLERERRARAAEERLRRMQGR